MEVKWNNIIAFILILGFLALLIFWADGVKDFMKHVDDLGPGSPPRDGAYVFFVFIVVFLAFVAFLRLLE